MDLIVSTVFAVIMICSAVMFIAITGFILYVGYKAFKEI